MDEGTLGLFKVVAKQGSTMLSVNVVDFVTEVYEAKRTETVTVCAPIVAMLLVVTEITPPELMVSSTELSAETPDDGTSLNE